MISKVKVNSFKARNKKEKETKRGREGRKGRMERGREEGREGRRVKEKYQVPDNALLKSFL